MASATAPLALVAAGVGLWPALATAAPEHGTVITSMRSPLSVQNQGVVSGGTVSARLAESRRELLNLRPPLGTRLAQIVPNNPTTAPPAAPTENPQVLEVPVGPENTEPQPVPAAPADGGNNTGTATNPATPITPPIIDTAPAEPVTPPVSTPRADVEGRQIADVRVVGNRVVPAGSILLQATTQRGAAYSSRQIELDRTKIDALGFFASVQEQVTPNLEDPAKVDVTFIVVENRVVTGFKFVGNTQVPTEELQKVLTTKTGTVLNRNQVNGDIEKVQNLYRERGFAAIVSESLQLADGTLQMTLQEGRISRIEISGLKKTSEELVRRQIRTKPGDAFDQIKLQQDLNRIADMGFFEPAGGVDRSLRDDPDQPGSIILTIILKERRTGQLSLGLGFDNRSKITGFLGVADTNFRGTGRRVSANAELGSRRTFELGYGDPFVGENNASYDFSLFNRIIYREPRSVVNIAGVNVDQTLSFEERRTGLRANFTKPLDINRDKSILFGLRSERARLFQVDNQQNVIPLDLPADASGRVSALSAGYLRDKRDLRSDASRGSREQIIVEKAFAVLGGTTNFTKLDIDLRRYIPLMAAPKIGELPKLVLAGRLVAGGSIGQLPAFEQYFVGGPDTVRGYDVDERFGDNQIYSNLELRYRIQKKFSIVGFVDSGIASGGRFESADRRVLFSFGAGVRVLTPIGPVRLDIGRGRDGVRTHFAIGPTF
jgi:outer membrane protein insertion porin family